MKESKSLAEQIADLEDPAPRDFDPEAEVKGGHSSGEEENLDVKADDQAAREHYVDVGKSKLRKRDEVALGPQYAGSRISRDALVDDDDGYDDPFGIDKTDEDDSGLSSEGSSEGMNGKIFEGEESLDEGGERSNTKHSALGSKRSAPMPSSDKLSAPTGKMRSAARNPNVDMSDADMTDELSEDNSSGEEDIQGSEEDIQEDSDTDLEDDEDMDDDDENQDEQPLKGDASRAELRKMMGEEQKMVAATLSEAAKTDARKGRAVVQQRKAFDSILNTRIRLQKGLIATNTLPLAQSQELDSSLETKEAYAAAETAALNLWNQLNGLRDSISKTASTGNKRKFEATSSDSPTKLWEHMHAQDTASVPIHRSTLEKWSAKVHGTKALTATRTKLNPSNSSQQQSLSSVLDSKLADSAWLVGRTQIPRSCAPVQASNRESSSPNLYDDADFYQLLLKELVDQRAADASTFSTIGAGAAADANVGSQWSAMREAKTRKKVDTRASKGRKMRYTVHEKLQNFVAPEDRGVWGQRQVDELFGSLLGRKMRLDEGEDEDDAGEDSSDGEMGAEERLLLFRS
ncbi:MAG: hypothetical protein M4579_002228 [Chaenotheca gracillima]|nr:MAG: hypothetical protein M4579_002228 [Chaenotheca gracillima]